MQIQEMHNNNIHNNINYNNKNSVIIIMAGGLGKRMNSEIPKVLHKIKNKPMIVHVIERALELNVYKIVIVVGKYYNIIESNIKQYIKEDIVVNNIHFTIQENPLGTGNAILSCKKFLSKLPEYVNNICILSGDVPLIKSNTINNVLINTIFSNILISNIDEPSGYGRIIIQNNEIHKIVEEKDCSIDEKKIQIINSGIYSFNIQILLNYIDKIDNNNANQEYYLTQIFEILKNNNIKINYTITKNINEITGINTVEQLKNLENLEN